jgi:hypothetical protein
MEFKRCVNRYPFWREKNGTKSILIQNIGRSQWSLIVLTVLQVFLFYMQSMEPSSSWELWYSTNSGTVGQTEVRLLHRLPHCKLQHFLWW